VQSSRCLITIIMADDPNVNISVVSYNMHGFNQGFSTVRDLCISDKPNIFLLQEHWLAPCNLVKFEQFFPEYFAFGSSAMSSRMESGLLSGRPFGGVVMLINNNLQKITRTLYSAERCVIVKVFNYLIVNVYLPCVGTVDRSLIIDDVLNNISNYLADYSDCSCLIGGDFNCDLDGISQAAELVNDFASDNYFNRCDTIMSCPKVNTYVNTALNCSSCVDFFLISDKSKVIKFDVIDDGSNLSDHLPIVVSCQCSNARIDHDSRPTGKSHQTYLRWDHADLGSYYLLTGQHLQKLLNEYNSFEDHCNNLTADSLHGEVIAFIEHIYMCIVNVLSECAKFTVPVRSKQFYKFWWDQELDCLKEDSISAHKLWKAAGKPRLGPLFAKSRSSKLLYKKRIRECQRQETSSYTNDLHDALVNKQGNAFWKCWRSKFESNGKRVNQVDGVTDEKEIINIFEQHFSKTCSNLTVDGSNKLKKIYSSKRPNYCGLPFDDYLLFDVELIDKSVSSLDRGKAAGLDSLTAEHLQHSHPALPSLLSKLFNLMIKYGLVPSGFGLSYTVPLPKTNNASVSKSLIADDFRGISISPVISKVFEKCIFDRYQRFFETSDSQFGFKKGISCSHVVYSVKCTVDHFVSHGSTVNLCALDLRKAFDKMNHHGLFIKLMERMLPNNLLATLEYWFSICSTCVRWGDSFSNFIKLKCGVRQGGVLSPKFFALYIDDVIKVIQRSNIGCMIGIIKVNIFLFADDIIMLAPSVDALQKMIVLCESQLAYLDMALNAKKSVCLRIGSRYRDDCSNLITASGETLCWVDNCRYLGVYLVAAKKFTVSISNNKKAFYRSFNAIFSKVGRCASEEVIVTLISAKCLPVFLYGLEACSVSLTQKHTLDFVLMRTFMRVFKTNSVEIVSECQQMFRFRKASILVDDRKRRFLNRFVNCDNVVCNVFAKTAESDLQLLTCM